MDKLLGALNSKTIWFNALLTVLGGVDWITGHAGLITAVLPVAAPYLAIVGPIGIILRFLTKVPVEEKSINAA